jgi:hypothetical protein
VSDGSADRRRQVGHGRGGVFPAVVLELRGDCVAIQDCSGGSYDNSAGPLQKGGGKGKDSAGFSKGVEQTSKGSTSVETVLKAGPPPIGDHAHVKGKGGGVRGPPAWNHAGGLESRFLESRNDVPRVVEDTNPTPKKHKIPTPPAPPLKTIWAEGAVQSNKYVASQHAIVGKGGKSVSKGSTPKGSVVPRTGDHSSRKADSSHDSPTFLEGSGRIALDKRGAETLSTAAGSPGGGVSASSSGLSKRLEPRVPTPPAPKPPPQQQPVHLLQQHAGGVVPVQPWWNMEQILAAGATSRSG